MRCAVSGLLAYLTVALVGAQEDSTAFEETKLFNSDDPSVELDNGIEEVVVEEVRPSVFVMEHGFLASGPSEWLPRGTLLLSMSSKGVGFEARLSEAKEFVELKPKLQERMANAADNNEHYTVRMYSPESPKRTLQSSIPASLLANNFEDWHDILEVTMGPTGVPVSLSYRTRQTLGLSLFDHTQVHLVEPSIGEKVRLPPPRPEATGAGAGPGAIPGEPGAPPPQEQGGVVAILKKYWWAVILILILFSNASAPEEPAAQGKAGGGGGGRRA